MQISKHPPPHPAFPNSISHTLTPVLMYVLIFLTDLFKKKNIDILDILNPHLGSDWSKTVALI